MAQEEQQRWDTAPFQGIDTTGGARAQTRISTATTRTVQGTHYHAAMAYLFPKPLGSTWLFPPSTEPQATRGRVVKFLPCKHGRGRKGKVLQRVVCGRVEAGITTAPEAGGEPYSSSFSPEKDDTRRIRCQTKQHPTLSPAARPSASAAPRALRRPRAAARMEEEDEGGGGRGAAGSPAASARFVRCLYAVGFLVSHGVRPAGPAAPGNENLLLSRPKAAGACGASLQLLLRNAGVCSAGGV